MEEKIKSKMGEKPLTYFDFEEKHEIENEAIKEKDLDFASSLKHLEYPSIGFDMQNQNGIKIDFDDFTHDQLVQKILKLEHEKSSMKREIISHNYIKNTETKLSHLLPKYGKVNQMLKEKAKLQSEKIHKLKSDKKDSKQSKKKMKILLGLLAKKYLSEMNELNEKVQKMTEKIKEYEDQKSKIIQNYQRDYNVLNKPMDNEENHKKFLIEKILELRSLLRAKDEEFQNCSEEKSELFEKVQELTEKAREHEQQKSNIIQNCQKDFNDLNGSLDNEENHKKFLIEKILELQSLLRTKNEQIQTCLTEKSDLNEKVQILTEKVKQHEDQNSRFIQNYQKNNDILNEPTKYGESHKKFLMEKIFELQSLIRAENTSIFNFNPFLINRSQNL